jgi:hypothetical protein
MKKIATPMKFKKRDGTLRDDLTEEELIELSNYQPLPLTPVEIAVRDAEMAALVAEQNARDIAAALLARRKQAAENYDYAGVTIKLDSGVRTDLAAYYMSLMAGDLAEDFVLPWSEAGYEGTELQTIYITKAELADFCLGAKSRRERAFMAYAMVAPALGMYPNPQAAEAAFDFAFAATAG